MHTSVVMQFLSSLVAVQLPLKVQVVGQEGGSHEDGLVVRAGTRRESHKEVIGIGAKAPAGTAHP